MASRPTPGARLLSTSARVHPSYLPYLHNASRGQGMKWIPPIVALVGVGYGVTAYRDAQVDKHLAMSVAAEQAEAERRRRESLLADAYGDRSSLEGLEQAMKVYEAQGRGE
ncbi:hypothetical protein B0T24DRAFT_674695 [Lasiosphaeria ovina]|uniref:Uncharacterized protein n=1 Tax=Lasiosphaeria ovina TaxID=92902 RepID=A0AAE0KLU6_9PEZI|nr:hypothetical protein B0T24DRAFT_674695 [Lasiosphaeria ovina]